VWAALAGSLVFWGLRLGVRPAGLPPQVQTVATEQAVRGDVLRMLGSVPALGTPTPTAPAAASRFKLVGAIVETGGTGWAMLAVDDRPARVVRVGARVDGDWVLQSISAQQVAIGPAGAPAQVTLDLPRLPPPATGVPGQAAAVPGAGGGVMPGGGLPQPGGAIVPQPAPVPQVQVPVDGMVSVQPPIVQAPPDGAGTVSGGAPTGQPDPGAVR